jgi:phosphoglucosamine mutase
LFGTDGIRGVAGEFPLDPPTVERIGRSLANRLAGQLGRPASLVIGRDTRESGPTIQAALTKGASAAGARVSSAGVITTPGVAYITRIVPFDAGVVISASHNPYGDNGIKVFSPSGKKLDDETERQIEADLAAEERFPAGLASQESEVPGAEEAAGAYRNRYVAFLVDEVGGGLDLRGLRIGIDCANGAASTIAPEVFGRLGANVEILASNPNGRNINDGCGSLNTAALQTLVRERRLHLGVAFDGDADRALFVDDRGALVDGDAVMLMLADHLRSHNLLNNNLVVATVMSNVGLEVALGERGIRLTRAQVGDRYVLEQLLSLGGSLGGEQSGHIIFPALSLAGDGIITAIELIRALKESGKPLSELAAAMHRFPQVLVNVRVNRKPPFETLPDVKSEMDRIEQGLQGRGRLLVRYSGTENLARVMIEGEDQAQIERDANALAEVINRAIG